MTSPRPWWSTLELGLLIIEHDLWMFMSNEVDAMYIVHIEINDHNIQDYSLLVTGYLQIIVDIIQLKAHKHGHGNSHGDRHENKANRGT